MEDLLQEEKESKQLLTGANAVNLTSSGIFHSISFDADSFLSHHSVVYVNALNSPGYKKTSLIKSTGKSTYSNHPK